MEFDPARLTASEKKHLLEEQYKKHMLTELERRRRDADFEMQERDYKQHALKEAVRNSLLIFVGVFLVLRMVLLIIQVQKEEPQATLIELDRSSCIEYSFPGKWMNAYECHWTSPVLGECYSTGMGSFQIHCEKENAQPHTGN